MNALLHLLLFSRRIVEDLLLRIHFNLGLIWPNYFYRLQLNCVQMSPQSYKLHVCEMKKNFHCVRLIRLNYIHGNSFRLLGSRW